MFERNHVQRFGTQFQPASQPEQLGMGARDTLPVAFEIGPEVHGREHYLIGNVLASGTDLGVYESAQRGDAAPMEVKQIRLKNLRKLVSDAGGPTAFSEKVDRTPNLVTQWTSSKPIGDKVARHIEEKLRKPRGWLDSPQWAIGVQEQPAFYVAGNEEWRHMMQTAIVAVVRELADVVIRDPEHASDIILAAYDFIRAQHSQDEVKAFLAGIQLAPPKRAMEARHIGGKHDVTGRS